MEFSVDVVVVVVVVVAVVVVFVVFTRLYMKILPTDPALLVCSILVGETIWGDLYCFIAHLRGMKSEALRYSPVIHFVDIGRWNVVATYL